MPLLLLASTIIDSCGAVGAGAETTGLDTDTTVAPFGSEFTLTVTETDVPGGTADGTDKTS